MDQIVNGLRTAFQSGRTRSLQWRKNQLNGLIRMFTEQEKEFVDALKKDLNKCKYETMVAEVEPVKNEAALAHNELAEWTKHESVPKNLLTLRDTAYIAREPFGVALVIGAWNYPISVTILPVIGAIAAGNCVIIKPSELSANTQNAFATWIPKYLDQECIKVVTGGPTETQQLLSQKLDYVFYTGGTRVGQIVYEAAAKKLTPCTLELGGKCATYIDSSVELDMVAHRLIWGKCLNAGQTCIAPDYVLCQPELQESLIKQCISTIKEYYGEDQSKSPDYGRIVNENHIKRLRKLITSSKGKIQYGGEVKDSERYIQPTLITGVNPDDSTLQEEIFGPVLPFVSVKSEMEAIEFINKRSNPLTIYLFTSRQEVIDLFEENTSSGALVVNDTLVQNSMEALPFGGIGESGFGSYHGRYSFETFSHRKSVLLKHTGMEMANRKVRYPPFTPEKLGWAQWLLGRKPKTGGWLSFLGIGVASGAAATASAAELAEEATEKSETGATAPKN